MTDIVLATINAKYIHASFGLRYLMANLNDLQKRAAIVEFEIKRRPLDICEELLRHSPRVLGLGIYIWNAVESLEVVKLLKKLSPDLIIVLGGPEVSHETEEQEICHLADFVITGEADITFRQLCTQLLDGIKPPQKIIKSPLVQPSEISLPYDLYTEDDCKHRVVYVEASRGCPFTCEFCLSSLDIPVRAFELEQLLEQFNLLLQKGVRNFKFVDRTFNLNMRTSEAILDFFYERLSPDLFLHFEMIPDRFPDKLQTSLARFPEGVIQLEIGIQTFNPEVSARIQRRQNYQKVNENLRILREQTGAYLHVDLIAGLPGEDLNSFGDGFDHLISLAPHEIQVGILKRLRGTPIKRHDSEFKMVYSSSPPYEILCNKEVSFDQMQKMRRFARFWDLVANSGNFIKTLPLLWSPQQQNEQHAPHQEPIASENNKDIFPNPQSCLGTYLDTPIGTSLVDMTNCTAPSPFWSFWNFSDWLYKRTKATHGIALERLTNLLIEYITYQLRLPQEQVLSAIEADCKRCGRDLPRTLIYSKSTKTAKPKRQSRHLGVIQRPHTTSETQNI